MSVRIEKHSQLHVPIDIVKLTRDLIDKIPQDHLIGLESIILVDKVSSRKNKQRSRGIYWSRSGSKPASIEISVVEVYKGMPRFLFLLPFVPKFIFANTLYHEVGHHRQQQVHGVSKKDQENFADQYRKEMTKKAFIRWRFFIYPFAKIVCLLNWVVNGNKANKEGAVKD